MGPGPGTGNARGGRGTTRNLKEAGLEREEFISSLQAALGKGQRAPAIPYHRLQEGLPQIEERARAVLERLEGTQGELLDSLGRAALARGWKVHRSTGSEGALGYITRLAECSGDRPVVRSDQEVFHSLPVDGPLASMGIEVSVMARAAGHSSEELRQAAARAGIGITGVDYAIAETGTVVLVPRAGLSRLVSLLPPVHVAIVRPEEVVEDLDDLFALRRLAYYRGEGDMGSYMNFITGPSRTADIEQTLVVGVHGPKEAHMVILE